VDPFLKLARVPSRPPRSDLLLAGVLAVWAVLEALFVEGPGSTPERVAVALAFTVPLVFRRQAPLLVLLAIVGVELLVIVTSDVGEAGTMPVPALLVATFSVALYARRAADPFIGLAVTVAAVMLTLTTDYYTGEQPGPTDLAIMSLIIGGFWSMGYALRRRAAQARQAMAESGELARNAVAEERARIARELHDVIAHSVSVIAVQAGAAEQQLESDPDRARDHLDTVRRTSREAMNEMRRLLDVLREEEASYVPQPGLSRLPELVETARDSGLEVEVKEEGERPELPPGLDLTVYRIVQEALTNVRKHAGAVPTEVRLRYEPGAVELDVTNELAGAAPAPNGSGGGHGLVGMKERARLFGGTLEAGSANGGFRVHARLPIEENT
jgi:signal transduction histidine kinase